MITQKRLADFYHQFATLVNSGVNVNQALRSLLNSTYNSQLGRVVAQIGARIEQGETLAGAMAAYPNIFSALQLRIVDIGERTGRLGESLYKIGDNLERNYKIQTKFITGFLYPVFLLHAVIFIPAVPKLILEGFLPFLRQVAVGIIPLYSLGLIIILTAKIINRVDSLKRVFQYIFGSIPVVGSLVKRLAIARFMWNLSALYNAGENMVASVKIAAESCDNIPLENAVLKTLPEIERGGSLTSAFMRIRVFPSTVIEMLSAGEHSGKIGDMLEKIAEHYETEYETIVKRLVIILPLFIYMLVMLYIAYVIISFWMGYFQQMGGIL
jgi:type IV pilus assembly protein PilC